MVRKRSCARRLQPLKMGARVLNFFTRHMIYIWIIRPTKDKIKAADCPDRRLLADRFSI